MYRLTNVRRYQDAAKGSAKIFRALLFPQGVQSTTLVQQAFMAMQERLEQDGICPLSQGCWRKVAKPQLDQAQWPLQLVLSDRLLQAQ